MGRPAGRVEGQLDQGKGWEKPAEWGASQTIDLNKYLSRSVKTKLIDAKPSPTVDGMQLI